MDLATCSMQLLYSPQRALGPNTRVAHRPMPKVLQSSVKLMRQPALHASLLFSMLSTSSTPKGWGDEWRVTQNPCSTIAFGEARQVAPQYHECRAAVHDDAALLLPGRTMDPTNPVLEQVC